MKNDRDSRFHGNDASYVCSHIFILDIGLQVKALQLLFSLCGSSLPHSSFKKPLWSNGSAKLSSKIYRAFIAAIKIVQRVISKLISWRGAF